MEVSPCNRWTWCRRETLIHGFVLDSSVEHVLCVRALFVHALCAPWLMHPHDHLQDVCGSVLAAVGAVIITSVAGDAVPLSESVFAAGLA